MSWTVLVKSPVIPQWADFSVTAPSGLVPWPAFYYGTEVVTVVGWWSLPASIANTWWYIWNYEWAGSSPVSVTNLASKLNTTLSRYFLIATYRHPAWWWDEYYNHLYELNTSTNTWINRWYAFIGSLSNFQYHRVYERASNLGIRFVVNSWLWILNNWYYSDYTYSTNTFSWWTTVSSVVWPDPWLWLTQINNWSYDSIWWYAYKPFVSVGKAHDPINNTSVVITVTL